MENMTPRLPPPLSEDLIKEVLQELPTGARLATETCYTCWKENKFPTPEFLSFLRSISTHSKILRRLFPADGSDADRKSTPVQPSPDRGSGRPPSESMSGAVYNEAEILPETSDNETDRIQHQKRLAEIQRRRLEPFQGAGTAQVSRFLQWMLVELRGLLPSKGQLQLVSAVRQYLADPSEGSVQDLARSVQATVDDHNIQIPLVFTPHRVREPEAAAEGKKRSQPDKEEAGRRKEGTSFPPPPQKAKKKEPAGGSDGGNSVEDEKDLSDEELMVLSKQLGRQLGGPSKLTTCEDLHDTFLGQFLASRARAACSRDVVVKVVADVLKQLFAFLRVDNSPHFVLCFGMYVHEYGPGCAPAHAGRVYIECVDSVPLYGKEKGEERQALLSNIVLGYFDFVRDMGFRYAHMRVPPPTDENSHIFASRSLIVRLRASLHLAHWFKRLLATAQQNGIIQQYESAPSGNMPNFPLSLLHPAEMAAELAFRNVDLRTLDPQSQQLMLRVTQLKERFFVVSLQRDAAPKPHVPDMSPLLDGAIAADRSELVGVCISQRLRFATVQQAKYATMMLVHRMEAEQVRSAGQEGAEMQGMGGPSHYPAHQGDGRAMMGGIAGQPGMGMAEMGAHGGAAEVERRLMMQQQMQQGRAQGGGQSPGWMGSEQGGDARPGGSAGAGGGGGGGWEEAQYGPRMGMGGGAAAQAAVNVKTEAAESARRMQHGSPGYGGETMLRDMAMMMRPGKELGGPVRRGMEGGMDLPPANLKDGMMSGSAAASFADSFMVDLDAGDNGAMYAEHGGMMGEMLGGQDDGGGGAWSEDGVDPSAMGERAGDLDEVGNWGY